MIPMKAANMPTGSVVATSDEVYIKRATLDIRPWESAAGFSSNERIDALIACGDAEVLRVGASLRCRHEATERAGAEAIRCADCGQTLRTAPAVTSGGVELTPKVEAALVAEAEAGYDTTRLRPRRIRHAKVHNTAELLAGLEQDDPDGCVVAAETTPAIRCPLHGRPHPPGATSCHWCA